MKITFLGTGTSTGVPEIGCKCEVCTSSDPRDRRLRCSALLQDGDTTVLIDCGPDFRQQMLTYNIKRLDAVLLTHHHYDHVSGLDELRSFTKDKAMPICAEKYVEDTIKRTFPYCFGINKYPGVATFDIKKVENIEFEISNINESIGNIEEITCEEFKKYYIEVSKKAENKFLELIKKD